MLKLSDLAQRQDFRVGPLSVSPSRRKIEGSTGEIHVEPLVMQVFLLLIDACGKVVTRQELFDQLWGGVMVGDDSLNRAVAGVRRIAVETGPDLFEIETIPRTGYRLTGEVLSFLEPADYEAADAPAGLSRRQLAIGGTAAAGFGALGIWAASRPSEEERTNALVAQADQVLRYEYSERGLKAIPLLQEALSIHPDNSAALGLLAYARAVSATIVASGTADEVPAAERAVTAALKADRHDPHARLALLLFQRGGFDWATTEDDLRSILKRAPRNPLVLGWLVSLFQAAGRNQLSWEFNEKVAGVDPISPTPQYRKALKHWIFGRTDDAYRTIDRLIQIWPKHPWVWNARFLIFAFTGRAQAALDMIDHSPTRPDTITPARMAQWQPTLAALQRPGRLAVAEAREANLVAARQSPGQAAYAVMALAGIGEVDAAYEVANGFLLSRGNVVTRRPTDRPNMLVNNPSWRSTQWLSTPPLAAFRADPRYSALCDAIGLTAYWRMRGIRPDYPNIAQA